MDLDYMLVYITVPSLDVGENIARILVGEKLAACVNIVPGITSIYSWQDAIEQDNELLLIVKTRNANFDRLSSTVEKIHPYDVPEIIGVPIGASSKAYLAWMDSETNL